MFKEFKNSFPTTIMIIETRKDSQWISKPVNKSILEIKVIRKYQSITLEIINYKVK